MKAHDDEEQHELLDKIACESQRPVDTRLSNTTKLPRRNPFATWFVWLVFTILLCLFASSLLGFRHKDELWKLISSHDRDQLAIKLHPSKHSSRDPTTLVFDWNITLGTASPDGVEKRVYLVNGEFPGPTIEARSGDRIVVNVHNGLQGEGVSLHWHGLRMKGYNSMDGAVGFTQCPIPSGSDFTYDFRIGDDEHGTFWWHSHAQLQRGDGLFGGLVVHKHRRDRHHVPHDEVLLLVGDWFHRRQTDVLAWYSSPGSLGNEPVPDSILINGRGRYDCGMAVPARPVKCRPVPLGRMKPLLRKRYSRTRLRIVNTGSVAGFKLKMDGATLRPMEVDGGCSVDARSTDSVGILYPGERVDLEVSWNEAYTGHPWLSVYLDDENLAFSNPALQPNHTFPVIPKTLRGPERKAPPLKLDGFQDLTTLSATATVTPVHANATAETLVFYIKTETLSVHGNKPMGFINRTHWEPPAVPLLAQPRSSWDKHQLVPLIETKAGSEPKHVTLVLNNLDDGSHPFHLHGYAFDVLSTYRAQGRTGFGSYDPQKTPKDAALGTWSQKPLRKDTIAVPRRGHVVLSLTADNPGIWMLHCHMLMHMGTGMVAGLEIAEAGVNDLRRQGGLDASAAQLCAAQL